MNKTVDMTKGNVFKIILLFALPLFIGNIFQLFYSLIDSVISSHFVCSEALAAIGATGTVNSFIIAFSCGMGFGASIVISRFFGENNIVNIRKSIVSVIFLNIVMSAIISTSVILCTDVILKALHVPTDIYQMARDYFVVTIAGLLATLLLNTMSGILRAVGNSRLPLYVLVASFFVNISLDLFFIIVCKLGVGGSALATLVAQSLADAFLIIYFIKKYPMFRIERADLKLNGKIVWTIFSTGISMGLMNSIYAIGAIFMTGAVNKLGTNIINAKAAGRRIVELLFQPGSSIASATSVFVAQNYGAKKLKRAYEGIIKGLVIDAVWAVMVLILFVISKPLAIWIAATEEPEVIDNACLYIYWTLPFYFPVGVLVILRNCIQSLGRKVIPFISSCIELVFKFISAFIWIPKMGFLGECITEPITWVVCSVFISTIFIIYAKTGVYERGRDRLTINLEEEK